MSTDSLFSQHERSFEANRFVYPVISRRSGGLSIGVNLNPDKICNFDCIYCQVNRTEQSETRFVEIDGLLVELKKMLELVASGDIWSIPKFLKTPTKFKRCNDIAFSGDGEPTTYKNFDEILAACITLKNKVFNGNKANTPKVVLITNASMFHRAHVQKGLSLIDSDGGEVWAKLDAGTEEYFQKVDRSPIRFARILENITEAAKIRPMVIQSLFMRIGGEPPSHAEQQAFVDRLKEMQKAGGLLRLIQVYTVARRPAEDYVSALSRAEVDRLVELVSSQTGLQVQGFYGPEC